VTSLQSDIVLLLPGFLTAFVGMLVFSLTIRRFAYLAIIALLASLSALMFFLVFYCGMPTPDRGWEWAEISWTVFCFGSPLLFSCMAIMAFLARTPRYKTWLRILCLTGLILSIVHTVLIWKALSGIP
jgi:hypothetical protein